MVRYSLSLEDGVVHTGAHFEARRDLNFKWRSGFVLYRDDGQLRWGLWDEHNILVSMAGNLALPFIKALLEKGYYLADTSLPKAIEDEMGGVMTITPGWHVDNVVLDDASLKSLREQKAFLEGLKEV